MGILELDNVSVVREGKYVLKDISLRIPTGMVTIITGRTGSGKSTLLKTAAGLNAYEKGRIFFKGEDIAGMTEKEEQVMQKQTGFMFQDAALWANRTLFDNLAYPLIVQYPQIKKTELNERVYKALESMDFAVNPLIRPAAISAGEKKIISFLRAIITEPEILFLDDPTTSIDRHSFNLLFERVKGFKKKGMTMVIVTENPLFIKKFSDNLVMIKDGELVSEGTYEDMSQSDDTLIKNFFFDL